VLHFSSSIRWLKHVCKVVELRIVLYKSSVNVLGLVHAMCACSGKGPKDGRLCR
jgi:hypothetical protein